MHIKFINKTIALTLLIFSPSWILAASRGQTHPAWTWIINNIIVILAGLVIVGVCFSLWNLMQAIIVDKAREYRKLNDLPEPIKTSTSSTFLSTWYNKISGLIPLEQEADLQLDHDYDGIRELDNSLPPWWLYGFYVSILVAIGYMYVYHYSDIGLSQNEEYQQAMRAAEQQKLIYAAKQINNIDENNLVALTDPQSLSVGLKAFVTNCVACHGQEGQGGVGPNLTDKYWIHGGSTPSIYKTIKNGVPEKGMIAWKSQMQPSTIHKLASYIQTLQGSQPQNPKEKQGVLYEGNENVLSASTK